MERVATLCEKLNDQLAKKAPVEQLLTTVQMLQSELMHLKSSVAVNQPAGSTAFNVPFFITNNDTPLETPMVEEAKIVEVLQVDVAEIEAELDEIKKNMDNREMIHAQNKPQMVFDPIEDTPTLTHQDPPPVPVQRKKELHESLPVENISSLNDKLKQVKIELSEALKDVAIKDLRKGIGVNDRFLFINELFRGDEVMYERSIKTINGFTIYPEAEYWIKRELKLKLAWNDSNPVVKQFDQLIRRRFAAM